MAEMMKSWNPIGDARSIGPTKGEPEGRQLVAPLLHLVGFLLCLLLRDQDRGLAVVPVLCRRIGAKE